MSDHHAERPLGGRILTPTFMVLLVIMFTGVAIVLYRLFYGLGSVSAMNDSYPWGIWKPFNVVTLTGIAAGAYAVGILTYVFNKGEYHPLMRSAILVGAMGYTLAGTSVLFDLGRWWNLWVVFFPPIYNLNSVLLEVAICVMAYCMVLWVEVSPAVLEHWSKEGTGRLRKFSIKALPGMKKALPWIIGVAILLPTMHQSSLGGLYMVTPTKLHGLWHTPWLSALFLISCATMGFGAVVIIENLTQMFFNRKSDQALLARMAVVPVFLSLAYLAIRIGDLAYRGRLGQALAFDFYSAFFIAELVLFSLPILILAMKKARQNRGVLFAASLMLIFSGALYRFDTYLVAYLPVSGGVYFPNIAEILVSLALVSAGAVVYIAMAKSFPILSGVLSRSVAEERAVVEAEDEPTDTIAGAGANAGAVS